jgi:hypothetical protein
MSDHLVHLADERAQLDGILNQGAINAAPLGAVAKHPAIEKLPSQRSCSLSEIPLDRLDRLAQQHGRYGVGFSKDFILSKNGARVWYLDQGVAVERALFESRRTDWYQEPDVDDIVWHLTPFIDYLTPSHRFEWEREWRVLDGLSFERADVRFLFGPEQEHAELLAELGLSVPIVDAAWVDEERIQSALSSLPPPGC